MPKLIYDFGRGCRERVATVIDMAIDLAIRKLGTTKRVCAALGVNRNVLVRWRNGARPRPPNLEALAKLADIPRDWLL